MSEINLLPTNVKVDKQTQKSVTLITRIAIAAGFIVMLIAIIGGALLFILNSNLQKAKLEYEENLAAVKELEATELNLVLIKDRLSKIQPILDNRNQFSAFEQYNQLVNSLPTDAAFKAIHVSSDTSKLTITSPNSDAIASVIKSLEDPEKYQVAILDELNFNNIQGFELVLTTN